MAGKQYIFDTLPLFQQYVQLKEWDFYRNRAWDRQAP